jgi:hypothetical protein
MRVTAAKRPITAQLAVLSNSTHAYLVQRRKVIATAKFNRPAMLNDRRKGMLNKNEIDDTRGDKLSRHAISALAYSPQSAAPRLW